MAGNERILSAHFVHVNSAVLDCTQVCDQRNDADELVPIDCASPNMNPARFFCSVIRFVLLIASSSSLLNLVAM